MNILGIDRISKFLNEKIINEITVIFLRNLIFNLFYLET